MQRIINFRRTTSASLLLLSSQQRVSRSSSSLFFSSSLLLSQVRLCAASASAVAAAATSNSTNISKLNLPQMETMLRRQFGPNAQLQVREQQSQQSRRIHAMRRRKEKQRRARRLDVEDNAKEEEEEELEAEAEAAATKFRSSVTFRQCGFNITLCTAESEEGAEGALRLAFNGAVATDVRFFNPTLRPQDAAVFDRVRFLALGLGKMIRFSIGGGGDSLTQKEAIPSTEASEAAAAIQSEEAAASGAVEDGTEDDSGATLSAAPLFSCTAYVKDDWDIGRSRDRVLLTTAGRSAQAAFSAAVHAVRDRLTKETEEGYHALEDVRELQRALNSNSAAATAGYNDFDSAVFGGGSAPLSNAKTVHAELFTGAAKSGSSGNHNNNNGNNYTAKLTVTDSFGNSYSVKSGDMNRSALAAYRSCVLQVYKREGFLQQQSSTTSAPVVGAPQKSFFGQIQWLVEHCVWHSGLARSLSWDLHFRVTMRSSFSAARQQRQQQQQQHSPEVLTTATGERPGGPAYLHATLHIGPVELAFADGVGRYRVMLNCYCNALERLLSSCPPSFASSLRISSVPQLYGMYTEADRFQPSDALKGAIKGLNPMTVLGAVCNLHFGHYYQQQWERLETQQAAATTTTNSGASEEAVYLVVQLPNGESSVTIGDATTIKPGTKGALITRALAAKLACTFALRDNFPLVYNQVRDRADFKHGSDRDQQMKLQRLRALPREKRVIHVESVLALIRELGAEDHGWADVDVDCVCRNSTLWVATCFARSKRDGSTRDLLVSRPSTTKTECRKRVILETAFKFFPKELEQYLAHREKKANESGALLEYSRSEIMAVMGRDAASNIRPYDPVASGSLIDQLLALLQERAETQLRMAVELVAAEPFPVSKQQLELKTNHEQQHAAAAAAAGRGGGGGDLYRCRILPTTTLTTAATTGKKDKTGTGDSVVATIPGGALDAPVDGAAPLFQAIRDCVLSAATALQLNTERIRLMLSSFEDYRIPQIFRPQDLAEWLIKATVGVENTRVDVNLSKNVWCAVLCVRFPVAECEWPVEDRHITATQQPSTSEHAAASAAASSTAASSSSIPRVYEWIELTRAVATTKREATKLCFIKAAVTNCFAHLTHLSRKSLEQQQDADAVLRTDLAQFDTLLQPRELARFMRVAPSPLAVLRAALRSEGLVLRINVFALDEKQQQEYEQQSFTTSKQQNPSAATMDLTMLGQLADGEVPLFECTLYSEENNNSNASDSRKTLARASGASPEDALSDCVAKALDTVLPDADLKHWQRRWNIEIESDDDELRTAAEAAAAVVAKSEEAS